ncbi:hypothetical protein [Frigoribacterium sp. SL97]|uniref:hypothetical protein n=1 Tax=Frigoribacterium sp. SL97 TaxID=2994664 RepID=UPI00226EAEC3|nr:hypothetical protein [Frigoribacterium sp. SL97]WAC50369.1 hypothetical protein OVA02_10740 [Frigoribacterium sp. SL97]
MKKRSRILTALAVGGVAVDAVTAHGTSALALWTAEARSTPAAIMPAKVELLVDGQAASGGWAMPSEALAAVTPTAPQAVALRVAGVSEGNAGLKYELGAPDVSGSTGLTDVLQAAITAQPSAASCTPGAATAQTPLYTGPLASANVDERPLVGSLPTTTTATEFLCVELSLPADYGHEASKVTMTADGSSAPVTAMTEWHGIVGATTADKAAKVTFGVDQQTFRGNP